VQPVDVGWVTASVLAVTTPMSLVEPKAVAHSPTVSWAAVAFPDFEYLVDELTVTVSGPGLGSALVGVAVDVEVVPRAKAMRVP
jgi:hypothetical protein